MNGEKGSHVIGFSMNLSVCQEQLEFCFQCTLNCFFGQSSSFIHIILTLYNLNNYFNFHVCLSIRPSVPSVPSVRKLTSIPTRVSQNIPNKSCLVCVKSEKYASWVTFRSQWDRCRQGEAKVRILNFKTTWSEFQMPS